MAIVTGSEPAPSPAPGGVLILHHAWSSTCSQKVRLCLAEKDLPYEQRVLDLRRFEQLEPSFLALNPAGYVPVLEHDGFVLSESTVINDYLDDRFPQVPLRPSSPRGRAEVALWGRHIDEVTSPAIKLPSFEQNMRPSLATRKAAELEAAIARMPNPETARNWREVARGGIEPQRLAQAHTALRGTLERMESALARGPWLIGEQYSLADVNMAPFVHRLAALEGYALHRDWPRVAAWYDRLRARPAFSAARFVEQRSTPETTSLR